jgi:hypothetical protein
MKRRSKWAVACLTAAALTAGTTAAFAAPASSPARTAAPAAHPDFDGIWQVNRQFNVQSGTKPSDGSPIPFLPWTKAVYDGFQKSSADGEPWPANHQFCLDAGLVRTMKGNFPFQVVVTGNQIVFRHEEDGVLHQIPIVAKDKAKHPKNPVPTWNGDAVAYWEGDTLVVDTIGYNEKVPFIPATFHTPALHTIDRIRLINNGTQLEVRMTIDDLGAYTKVWETRVVSDRVKDGYKIRDYRCAENNRDLPAVGNWGPW